MSMPSFPPCGADLTRDEALTMIIASIAMEELALSHIVNAEGEKLQYILGTLPGGRETRASTQEVLAVNKSITNLLDTVTQNQMLLKGKLDKALEAGGHAAPPPPEPPDPCPPPDRPPCTGSCCQKSAIQLSSRCHGFSWTCGAPLCWRCQAQRGQSIRWSEKTPELVMLDPEKAYGLSYAINVRGSCLGDGAGTILAKLTPRDAFSGTLPLYFSVKCQECQPLTLHCSTTLFPRNRPASHANLSLLLADRDSLFVDQASLSIVEL